MKEFLPGENPDELTETTPLISGGILDSIATLKLVMFLEERFSVSFEPHEIDKENLDDLAKNHANPTVRERAAALRQRL